MAKIDPSPKNPKIRGRKWPKRGYTVLCEGSPPEPDRRPPRFGFSAPMWRGWRGDPKKVPKGVPLEPRKTGACRGSNLKMTANPEPHPLEPAKTGGCRGQNKTDFSVFENTQKPPFLVARLGSPLYILKNISIYKQKWKKHQKNDLFQKKPKNRGRLHSRASMCLKKAL